MRRWVLAVALLVPAAGLAACGDGGGEVEAPVKEPATIEGEETVEPEPSPTEDPLAAEDLPALVLQPDELPEDLEGAEGDVSASLLEEFWPADCCQPQRDAFAAAGFVAAHTAFYEREDRSQNPSETGEGFAFVSSSAVLFATEEGAEAGMRSWIEYFGDDSFVPLDATGLGDEGFASSGTPRADEENLILYHWRVGNVVLHLRASGGGITERDVRPLADAMQLHTV